MKVNKYKVTEELRNKFLPILENFIKGVEENPNEYKEIDFTDTGINPYQIWKLLNELGYEDGSLDDNGWQMDFWLDFKKEGCVELILAGTGITFEVKLYTSEE